MGRHVFVPPSPILHGIDPHRAAHRCLPRERIPGDPGDGAFTPPVPGQLAQIGNDNTWPVLGGLDGGDEIENRTGGGGDLPDGAVGKNTKVLKLFAKIEDDPFSGGKIRRGKDGDVGIFIGGVEWKAGHIDRERLHAGLKVTADASLEPASVHGIGGKEDNELLNASRCRSLTRSFLEMK